MTNMIHNNMNIHYIQSERSRLLVRLLVRIRRRCLVGALLLCRRRRCSDDGRLALFGGGLRNNFVKRRLKNLDGVGQRLAGTELTLRIPALHAACPVSNALAGRKGLRTS